MLPRAYAPLLTRATAGDRRVAAVAVLGVAVAWRDHQRVLFGEPRGGLWRAVSGRAACALLLFQ
eukprot:3975-Chlamydomonas_euryale.AAC.1